MQVMTLTEKRTAAVHTTDNQLLKEEDEGRSGVHLVAAAVAEAAQPPSFSPTLSTLTYLHHYGSDVVDGHF